MTMFAKPQPKKTPVQGSKHKAQAVKSKTLSIKAGVKAPAPTIKRAKSDSKGVKAKPPPRPDAGYSLYSTDSEDQVTTAFTEMAACEKILTHLKSKQKGGGKVKCKVKKKEGGSPGPRPLNDNPPLTNIVPGLSSLYGTPFPYGATQFLRQLQGQDLAGNPMFNSRLASSTPDPEKLAADLSACRLGDAENLLTHEIPERDVSTVSSVPQSVNHMQNMAEMVEIYKRLEMNKAAQLQEAAAKEALQKLNAMDIHIAANSSGQMDPQVFNTDTFTQGALDSQPVPMGIPSSPQKSPTRDSGGFVTTQSLGFGKQGGSLFRPVPQRTSDIQSDNERNSSLTAFQPYLSTESNNIQPPQGWVPDTMVTASEPVNHGPGQSTSYIADTQKTSLQDGSMEVPVTGRSDQSDGTDYAGLRRNESDGQRVSQGLKIQPALSGSGNIVYEKQNGLYQIHKKPVSTEESSVSTSTNTLSDRSDPSEGKGQGHSQGSLDEVPERDLSNKLVKEGTAGNQSKPGVPSLSSKDGTFKIDGQRNDSQNLSGLTASTPRVQNMSNNSGTTSTTSCGGKIVFIPDNSTTPNVIGYVPGIPIMPGVNQPISLTVTSDMSGNVNQAGSVASGAQSAAVGQGTSDVSGSGYHSVATAGKIAAGDVGVRKLRYLLKELKECNKITRDVEVQRLVSELDEAVTSIPQLALTFNLQTEIDLALQPLRSENSQLRRKLRLVNQQLKEKEIDEESKDVNFEVLHLQTSNETLQKVLREERDIKTRLAAEVQYLYQEIHKMKVERSRLIAQTSEKETMQLKSHQELRLEAATLQRDLEVARKSQETVMAKLEVADKENHILQVTLQQRDTEIERQHEIVELMKESISDLVQELDQSRAGNSAWDHNQSYGLHRLLKIVEEEDGSTYIGEKKKGPVKRRQVKTADRKSQSPERRHFDFDSSGGTASTTKLTKAALAYHNKKHGPYTGRIGPDGKQGPASESELDTLVEMQGRGRYLVNDFTSASRPGHRRTNSSSPVRLKNDRAGTLMQSREVKTSDIRGRNFLDERENGRTLQRGGNLYREREDTIGQDSDEELSPSRRPNRSPYKRAPGRLENYSPPQRRAPNSNFATNRAAMGNNPPDGTEVSIEQSRYSVTDYFKKYHPSEASTRPKEAFTDRIDRLRPQPGPSHDYNDRPLPQIRTSSEIDDRTVKSSEQNGIRNAKRLARFRGGDEPTFSAIHDDDNVSSVSMTSVSTANTEDERKFRSGIATLDANIARLQQALQKTKSMLN